MIATQPYAEIASRMAGEPAPIDGSAARELACRYLTSVSAYWRGECSTPTIGAWLAKFWRPVLPPLPPHPADAVSPHGAGGHGISWYETPAGVIGHVAGKTGGYWIPASTRAPGSDPASTNRDARESNFLVIERPRESRKDGATALAQTRGCSHGEDTGSRHGIVVALSRPGRAPS